MIKGQDIVVLAKLMDKNAWELTYAELGEAARISTSEAHSAIRRLQDASLVNGEKRLMKRNKSSVATCVIGANKVDITNAKMYRDGNEVPLTAMEYKLLLVFINHAGEILDRDQILNILWDDVGSFVNDNTLTVYIKRLRSKLGDDEGELIETLRGQGYRLNL